MAPIGLLSTTKHCTAASSLKAVLTLSLPRSPHILLLICVETDHLTGALFYSSVNAIIKEGALMFLMEPGYQIADNLTTIFPLLLCLRGTLSMKVAVLETKVDIVDQKGDQSVTQGPTLTKTYTFALY
ncbi:uncharacterized protein N7479_009228 [Penicillium vulpinum]|uniref:uncharacterized protein n=1 Tax=Penicillium vulpinum TaxID=29845 RepID=UPI002549843E|nr:uncharacterized protein N7479_009228 [Penicillium vulpinum]KAJ5950815.1 hypothetical protein N7479_009228 [Penicillium vulpinum]